MDAAGIDTVVASSVIAGDVTSFELGEARAMAELLNEEIGATQHAYPDRFRGLAVLPAQDTGAAIEVLDDAIGRLGLFGVLLHSNRDGGSIADPELWPLYERIAELDVPLFLHPTRAFAEERVTAYSLEPPLSYMFDTTVAAMSLIVSGVLDALPDLKVVHPHFGGTLPYLVDRIDVYRRQGRWTLNVRSASTCRACTRTPSPSRRARCAWRWSCTGWTESCSQATFPTSPLARASSSYAIT